VPILHFQVVGQGQTANGRTVQLNPSHALQLRGPCVQVSVTLEQSAAQALLQQGGELPPPVAGLGLIDTGASVTCIDEAVARRLRLPTIDVVPMSSASHARTNQNVYPIQFEIVGFPIRLKAPRAIGAELEPQGLVLLIGRDALVICTLFYNGPSGEVTLPI
jgi:predicted aspartyl protease